MSTRTERWPQGTPCWVDLGAPDIPAARDFYGRLMGWTFSGGGEDYGGYLMCEVGDRQAAGLGPAQPGTPPAWTTYLSSDDAKETADRIRTNGGTVLVEPMDVMEQGVMGIALDPQGAVFGFWQAGNHIGATIVNEPGGFVWNEHLSADPDGARAFYGAVFGLRFQEAEGAGGAYTTFAREDAHTGGDDSLGGIGPLEGEGTPGWLTYFVVADADSSAAAIGEGGGTVVTGPEPTPYGQRLVATDPWGAAFALMAVAQS